VSAAIAIATAAMTVGNHAARVMRRLRDNSQYST
jgi:hypothetical protein